jgi:predicted metalloprotease
MYGQHCLARAACHAIRNRPWCCLPAPSAPLAGWRALLSDLSTVFAQAYVIAHEVAHHVQNLLGISRSVQNLRGQMNAKDANQLSVRTELQADCLSGVWAHHAERTKDILEQGDLEEAMNAATAIGDDRLQQQSRGYVTPDSFTHGTSEQRLRWFRTGFDTGEINACDTFEVREI